MAPPGDASFHAVQRRLATILPGDTWSGGSTPLELATLGTVEPPRLIAASVIEGRTLKALPVGGPPVPRFAAFLDGTQTSRVLAHVEGVPILHGTAAAVIRERVGGRMRTWRAPRIERRLYAPLVHLPDAYRAALGGSGLPVVDTLEGRKVDSPHPFALQDAAIHAVQEDREGLERELAEAWCESGARELLLDGSLTASERVASAACAVGMIKSHRTLYAEGGALRTILQLRRGERSSVLRVTSPRRTPVASWYLRMRDPAGRDPLWGLVRIEIADAQAGKALTARASEVSRWVLAEALPLAAPDSRWDKMVYGIRDCEEFLRAIQ